MHRITSTGLIVTSLLFLTFQVICSTAAAQEKKSLYKAKARIKYYVGEIDSARVLINELLNQKSVTISEKIDAFELLALCHIAQDEEEQAKNVLRKIIELDENYRPNLSVLIEPDFVKLVGRIREESGDVVKQNISPTKGRWPWLVAGAGVVGGVAVFLATRGGSGSGAGVGEFPGPPGRPPGN